MNKKVFVGILLGLWACKKDVPPPGGGGGIGSGQGVFVSNEGNFQAGNAGVSYFEEGFQEALADVFAPANNRPLGDVLQSMTFHNGRCYLVVNNSGKVEVVDAQTFKSEATIAGFTSPRYLLPVGNGKAYVSDLYGNALSVVDLTTHQRVGSIPCQGWTEEMVLADGRVFVANRSNAFLLVVDPQTDAIADTVVVGHGANSIRQDGAGKVWVLCSGNGANAAAFALGQSPEPLVIPPHGNVRGAKFHVRTALLYHIEAELADPAAEPEELDLVFLD